MKVFVGQNLGAFLSGDQGVLTRGTSPLLGPALDLRGTASGTSLLTMAAPVTSLPPSGDHAYLQSKLLRHIFGLEVWTPPGIFYVGIVTSPPTDADDGITTAEPADPSYHRIAVSGAGWTIDSLGRWVNNASITFPTASVSWGTLPYLVLYDSPIGGNVLKYARQSAPSTVAAGATLSLPSGSPRFSYASSAPVSTAFRRVLGEFVSHRAAIAGRACLSVSLIGDAPAVAGDAADMDEHAGDAFARTVVGPGSAWESSGDAVTNARDFIFSTPSASWGTFDRWAIAMTPFGGDVVAWGDLPTSVAAGTGSTPTIESGAIMVRLR